MKEDMKRALAAKAIQRAKAREKTFAEKLETIERMRDRRKALASGRSKPSKVEPAAR